MHYLYSMLILLLSTHRWIHSNNVRKARMYLSSEGCSILHFNGKTFVYQHTHNPIRDASAAYLNSNDCSEVF